MQLIGLSLARVSWIILDNNLVFPYTLTQLGFYTNQLSFDPLKIITVTQNYSRFVISPCDLINDMTQAYYIYSVIKIPFEFSFGNVRKLNILIKKFTIASIYWNQRNYIHWNLPLSSITRYYCNNLLSTSQFYLSLKVGVKEPMMLLYQAKTTIRSQNIIYLAISDSPKSMFHCLQSKQNIQMVLNGTVLVSKVLYISSTNKINGTSFNSCKNLK